MRLGNVDTKSGTLYYAVGWILCNSIIQALLVNQSMPLLSRYFSVVESPSDLKYYNNINKMTHCCHQVLRAFTKQGCYNVAMLIMKVQTSSELKTHSREV